MKIFISGLAAGLLLLCGQGMASAASAGPVTVLVGDAEVSALQDASGRMAVDIFRGASREELKKLAPSGSVEAGVTVFLVNVGGKTALIDTGNGPEGGRGALHGLLARSGVKPESVDAVLLTHMHGDHVGGLLREGKAAFPSAQVRVGRVELDFWTNAETKEKHPGLKRNIDLVAAVREAYGDNLKPFEFGEEVLPGITARDISGHTPGQALFFLASGGERLYFWGDLVHGAALQFANPEICATYDMDMPKAVSTRREVMAAAALEGIPVAGAHLPFPAMGRVNVDKNGSGFVFLPGIK